MPLKCRIMPANYAANYAGKSRIMPDIMPENATVVFKIRPCGAKVENFSAGKKSKNCRPCGAKSRKIFGSAGAKSRKTPDFAGIMPA